MEQQVGQESRTALLFAFPGITLWWVRSSGAMVEGKGLIASRWAKECCNQLAQLGFAGGRAGPAAGLVFIAGRGLVGGLAVGHLRAVGEVWGPGLV